MQETKKTKIFKLKKVKIVGVIPSFAFHRAKYCALELHRKLPQRFPQPEIIGLMELDWNEKLTEWKQMFGREYWCLRRPVAVFFNDKFIGSDLELLKLTTVGNIVLESLPRKNMSFVKEQFRKDYISYLRKAKRIYCYLDICVNNEYIGTLTFQLYSDLLPRTCENFKSLCLGNKGPLFSYKGSRIHRIVKNGWLQGGDIQYKTGGGGFSIFCDPLEDECFAVSHDRRGVLSMANGGRHWNTSQFFITLQASKWMDTHFVAFGQLIEGSHVIKYLENLETFHECPIKKVEIKNCGKLDLEDDEDIDAAYKEVPLEKTKPKSFKKVSEDIIKLIMEALTEALARKERVSDILDDGDVPSKMNLQLYFQGLYSIPDQILEDSAYYLRNLRRNLFRTLKPAATEIVEVLMYDLLIGVLTRMTTLDDIRETIGHDTYNKLVGQIDLKLELCQKPFVKRLVNQIISTAQSMISVVSKKVLKMKIMSTKTEVFQKRMQNWVQSFVLQESFKGDPYHISDRPSWSVPAQEPNDKNDKIPDKPCQNGKKNVTKDYKKLKEKFSSKDICCIGSELLLPPSAKYSDYFNSCMYDLKRVSVSEEERMPLLDLIETNRFRLRWLRGKENATKPKELICVEEKVRKWLKEVVYTPETSWMRDLVFNKDEYVFDHVEEILYGAMTAGLLEMYYFYEQYLKTCGGKTQKIVTRVISPENSEEDFSLELREDVGPATQDEAIQEQAEERKEELIPSLPPCTCGHPCCVCEFDPNYRPPIPSPEEVEEEEEKSLIPESSASTELTSPPVVNPCGPGTELVDLNAILAKKTALKPEEIDIRSFKWLKPYILSKGCDLKSNLALQVHKCIEGEQFSCKEFISKHSLTSKASLLSLSFSLAEIIFEKNEIKSEIKSFIYDLWVLYFNEMFKEAILENPPDKITEKEETEVEMEEKIDEGKSAEYDQDECKKILAETPDFDFTAFCARFAENDTQTKQEIKKEEDLPDEPPVESSVRKESLKTSASKENFLQTSHSKESSNQQKASEDLLTLEEAEEKNVAAQPVAVKKVSATEETSPGIVVKAEEIKPKKKKSPIIIQEILEESSGDESREMPPYTLPFWVKFLTQLTKQALGTLAKLSRLPRRLYFQTDEEINFDEEMKNWFEFNAFNPQPTKGREIMDFIAAHHKSIENLEETARSYFKKKKYSQLLNRCTRFTSASVVADGIIVDVIESAMKDQGETETVELYVSNLISSAVASSRRESQLSYDEKEDQEYEYGTDENASLQSEDN